jgi:ribonuclease T
MSKPVVLPLADRFRGFFPVVVDVETGGFNCTTDALLEIAAVTLRQDENGLLHPDEYFHSHIAPFPGANLEKAALEFTGIDPFHPLRPSEEEGVGLRRIFDAIKKAQKAAGCKRAVLVGHNAHFDLGFLNSAITRTNLKNASPFHPFSVFDTVTLSGLALGQTVLARACATANIPFDNREAHSALYDAQRTAELYCHIVNQWWEKVGPPPVSSGGGSEEAGA